MDEAMATRAHTHSHAPSKTTLRRASPLVTSGVMKYKAALIFMILMSTRPLRAGQLNGGTIVNIDLGKGVLFHDTTSKDGRYAVGWTIRPTKKGLAPVDWSGVASEDPSKVLDGYDCGNDELPGPYEIVDFVVDLKSGKTLALPTDFPNYSGKNRGYYATAAAWSEEAGGRRYGLVQNNARFFTHDFWLVCMDHAGMRQVEISSILEKKVNHILQDLRPVTADGYGAFYLVNENTSDAGNGRRAVFHGALADVPFEADIPKSLTADSAVDGTITLRLADGEVVRVSSDSARIDPFKRNTALKKADAELNSSYQALLRKLPPTARENLKQEQRIWLKTRNEEAQWAIHGASSRVEDEGYERAMEKSLLKSTKTRTAELNARLNPK
jgi:uncharacterized protein YecT (DUF1311 family)